MDVSRRRSTPSDQLRALTASNGELKAVNDLQAQTIDLQAQTIKSLQVAVTILLASTAGLGVGLGTSLTGAAVPIALASASAVVFGVITASIAILTFMRR